MILGDNPTGHGFVVRDLVLIELSGHAPPSSLGERGNARVKVSEKILLLAGRSEISILKLKRHSTNIKSIFGITNLIYFRGI